MVLDPKLMEILACPACHGRLRERDDDGRLQCLECDRLYPVRGGIPILLAEQAEEPDGADT